MVNRKLKKTFMEILSSFEYNALLFKYIYVMIVFKGIIMIKHIEQINDKYEFE